MDLACNQSLISSEEAVVGQWRAEQSSQTDGRRHIRDQIPGTVIVKVIPYGETSGAYPGQEYSNQKIPPLSYRPIPRAFPPPQ
ncbi:hypothetical protein CRG98_047027 [Punica granatum]|uniref:Uncharacterized protein n=1 Tax=Punica granatum TaxID=22663 RepID=A0A2I0HLI2_PUNGR|nr:hypothetical protein CRG98_047027 [Punica granatum]